MNFTILDSTIISGGNATRAAVDAAGTASTGGATSILGSPIGIILYIAFIGVIFYFIGIRPQKKREKKMQEMQSSIKVGDNVLLESGVYGRIADDVGQNFIIELGTNKTILVPILKQRISAKVDENYQLIAIEPLAKAPSKFSKKG